jgi:hypothetical protein
MPPLDYIIKHLQPYVDKLSDFPYPSYIVDYRFTIWVLNPVTQALLGRTTCSDLLSAEANLFILQQPP